MKFGTFNFPALGPGSNSFDVIRQGLEQAVAAETAGFHEVWLPQHNGRRYGMVGPVVVAAAAIPAATSRIRIPTPVSRLPLPHPPPLPAHLTSAPLHSDKRRVGT